MAAWSPAIGPPRTIQKYTASRIVRRGRSGVRAQGSNTLTPNNSLRWDLQLHSHHRHRKEPTGNHRYRNNNKVPPGNHRLRKRHAWIGGNHVGNVEPSNSRSKRHSIAPISPPPRAAQIALRAPPLPMKHCSSTSNAATSMPNRLTVVSPF